MQPEPETHEWTVDDRPTEEIHREMRENEFFGWALGRMRERRRLCPESQPAESLLAYLSGAMTCGHDGTYALAEDCYTILNFTDEFGWPAAVQLIGSAMRELEREVR